MNIPGARDIEDMTRLMAIMEGRTPQPMQQEQTRSAGPITVGPPPAPGTADAASIADMRNILSAFHGASGGAAKSMVREAKSDPRLAEAMTMVETPRGARIGDWDIEVREEGARKLYDIVRHDEKIAADLTLYEAALGIVRALNRGLFITSDVVRSILKDEAEYAVGLHDAILFKKRLTEGRDPSKKAVHEARYSDARAKAVAARERIKARVSDLDG